MTNNLNTFSSWSPVHASSFQSSRAVASYRHSWSAWTFDHSLPNLGSSLLHHDHDSSDQVLLALSHPWMSPFVHEPCASSSFLESEAQDDDAGGWHPQR